MSPVNQATHKPERREFGVEQADQVDVRFSWEPSRMFLKFAIVALLAGASSFVVVLLVFAPEQKLRLVGPLVVALVALIAWGMLRVGRLQGALHVLALGSWLSVTTIAWFTGGVRAPAIIAYPVIIVMIGWLIGARTALAAVVFTVMVTVGFVLAEAQGYMPTPQPTQPVMHGVLQVVIFILSWALIDYLVRAYRKRLIELRQLVAALQQSQEHLRSSNDVLEVRVTERTRELDELNRTLDQRVRDEMAKRKAQEFLLIQQSRLAAMGEMIGAIAHQWRQPLNAMSLVLQNMRLQYQTGRLTDDSMSRMQEKADQLVSRMSSTIDEFRNIFKPDKTAEVFNLWQNLRSTVDIMEGIFRSRSIVCELSCDASIELQGIPGEYSQVMLNLLSNAKDAVLDSNQPEPRIWVRVTRVGERLQIAVEDNGGGIAPDIADKIFEPYFTTKAQTNGTGIGLYMSKMIVENNMNGQLVVLNTPQGASFVLDVPTGSGESAVFASSSSH